MRCDEFAVQTAIVRRVFEVTEQVKVLRCDISPSSYHARREYVLEVEERHLEGGVEQGGNQRACNHIARTANIVGILFACEHKLWRVPERELQLDYFCRIEI